MGKLVVFLDILYVKLKAILYVKLKAKSVKETKDKGRCLGGLSSSWEGRELDLIRESL